MTTRAATAAMAMASGTGSGRRQPSAWASATTGGAWSARVAAGRIRAQVVAAAVRTPAAVSTRAADAGATRLPARPLAADSSSDNRSGR